VVTSKRESWKRELAMLASKLKITKERVYKCHITGAKEVKKGLCEVEMVPSRARKTIWLDEFNDPRPGGHETPLRRMRGGVCTICTWEK
jgi:hypothetical protein